VAPSFNGRIVLRSARMIRLGQKHIYTNVSKNATLTHTRYSVIFYSLFVAPQLVAKRSIICTYFCCSCHTKTPLQNANVSPDRTRQLGRNPEIIERWGALVAVDRWTFAAKNRFHEITSKVRGQCKTGSLETNSKRVPGAESAMTQPLGSIVERSAPRRP
jgi:hypothetical protein